MRDIIPGLIVLGIGLFTGTSMFRGDFSLLSVFFDGFGIFFVGRGVYRIYQSRSK
jgi:hypothetical protein